MLAININIPFSHWLRSDSRSSLAARQRQPQPVARSQPAA